MCLIVRDQFPIDDSGYGFDNIGDVLSVSPLLMEKLTSAAQRISRVAVYGESYPPQPSLLVKIKPKKSQDDSPASGDLFPYSMRGALYGVYHFPVDGEYEFRWRYSNLRGDQPARRHRATTKRTRLRTCCRLPGESYSSARRPTTYRRRCRSSGS